MSLSLSRTFTSLQKYRNYRLLFQGQVVSQVGLKMQDAAQTWLVLDLTHSAQAVGVVTLCLFGPYAVLGLLGGPIADRFEPRKTLLVTQTLLMLCTLALAVLGFSGHLTVWAICLIALLRGTLLVVNNPVRSVMVRQSVQKQDLANAVALNSTIFNAARIVGPALAGLLLASVGASWCFLLNAVAFTAVIAGVLAMRPAELYPLARKPEKAPLLTQLSAGLQHAWHTPLLRTPFLVLLVVSLFCINFNVSLPILARLGLHLDAVGFGMLSAVFGTGALIGALVSASQAKPTPQRMLLAGLGLGGALVLTGLSTQVWLAGLGLFATGVCFTLYTTTTNALVQLQAADHMQGRIAALYAYIFTGTNPLGGLLIGWLASQGGQTLAFVLPGLMAVLAVLVGGAVLQQQRQRQQFRE